MNKKPATEVNTGYKNPQRKHTAEPKTITGTRPYLSASLPLKGLDIIAVNVKSEMISPLYSAPPRLVRYEGSSGTIMLKLAKNSNELKQSNQN